jgi:hypothetical protein
VHNNVWLSLVMAGVHLAVMFFQPTLPAIVLGGIVSSIFGSKSAIAGVAVLLGYLWLASGIFWAPINAYGLSKRMPWSRMSTLVYAALSIPTGVGAPYGVHALLTLGSRPARDDFERRH